jgi:hypothetical protein
MGNTIRLLYTVVGFGVELVQASLCLACIKIILAGQVLTAVVENVCRLRNGTQNEFSETRRR